MTSEPEPQPPSFSEAIRLGAMLGPQIFGEVFGDDDASCGNGAAFKAAGCRIREALPGESGLFLRQPSPNVMVVEIPEEWHPVMETAVVCPQCQSWRTAGFNILLQDYVPRVVAHLNDDHRWTREAIADWVESIEKSLAKETEAPCSSAHTATSPSETIQEKAPSTTPEPAVAG